MTDPSSEACRACLFAGNSMGYDSFICRRHAPIAVHDPNKNAGVYEAAFVPRWPVVSGSDWCGDFLDATKEQR